MNEGNSDRNLLIGILALQLDFIGRDQLVEAMHAWVLDKSQSLDNILLRQKAIDAETRELILALVRKHVDLHQGETGKSLTAASSFGSSVTNLLRSIADSDIDASLVLLAAPNEAMGPPSVTTMDMASGSNAGLRFRVLRPHAMGGLGMGTSSSATRWPPCHAHAGRPGRHRRLADTHDSQGRLSSRS